MTLSTSQANDTQIVTVNAERIDASMAIQFKEQMRLETNGGNGRVILDLSNVDFIDSSGLGAIVASMKQLESTRQLDLAGLTPNVDKVFRLTRMDTVFQLYETLNDALSATAN